MSIEPIDNDADDSSKRLANWYAAQAAAKSFSLGQTAKAKISITTKDSNNANADGDTYQAVQTSSVKLYDKNGKVVSST
jgi:hypothetical protein